MKIAFIGLGNMGEPMASNLANAGYEVYAYDVMKQKTISAEKKGCIKKESLKSAVKGVDFVVTMLPEGRHVKEAYLTKEGIVNNASPGTILIECSTIDVETTKKVGEVALCKDLFMIDCPVSGGTSGAVNSTLTFMVGGNSETLKLSLPLLNVMGKKIVHVGELGSGQAAKACNNMLLGISMIALGEAFTLADKLGLDQKKLFQISSEGSGMSWAMLNHLPVSGIVDTAASNNNFKAGFAAHMMLKDLTLALSAADSTNFKCPIGSLTKSLYEKFVKSGGGSLDYSAIIKLINGTHK
ncbi:MAG: 3-hydroxyisobutyrate dehydrogenase [Alphaproteobacteria bacterium MarineAlpha9_Bin2]|nr:MAG: 3-hydroxyisobutyrate dehydrogenase [Alphaproteobacteria bacterium MarineAlpha9_Bin2]